MIDIAIPTKSNTLPTENTSKCSPPPTNLLLSPIKIYLLQLLPTSYTLNIDIASIGK